ncbi:MAG: acyl-CoA dehydrogenase family protein [Porticoccaceae bacterium]|nr:acyl-CoA dehydrogenase family protein [Porticoccaceae bacterium]
MKYKEMDQDTYNLFLDTLKRYVKERMVPAENEVVEANEIPEHILEDMRNLGIFGLNIAEEYGGAGMSASQYLNALTEMSWAAPAYRAIMAIGNGIVNTALTKNGTEAQKQTWLPAIASGAVAAFAITEPGSGSDSAAMRSMAVKDGDTYVLNGLKRYISNAPFADVILVIARTSSEDLPKNGHISAFLVPTDTLGVSIGKPDKKMGQQGAQIADIIFEDARLPASALLGELEGNGFQVAMNSLNNGRLSVAAASLGSSKRALDSAIRYGMQRTAFGDQITSFQLTQAKIADSQADIYAMECMLRDAASKLDQGLDIRLEAACVKMFASEACGRIVDRVVQIYGGAGYIQDYEAERFFRDSRLYRIFEGTTEIMQLVIARTVLQQYEKGLA